MNIQRALHYLILNCSFTPDLGLFHGKMGCVIFFAYYSRLTDQSCYAEFASKLLDEIYEDMHHDIPYGMESGLCGIGWGIEYLIQNKYIEGNSDEILEDIDALILEHNPRKILDLSFRTGLAGIIFYITARLSTTRIQGSAIPFDTNYLYDLKNALLSIDLQTGDKIPSNLKENFLKALSGEKVQLELSDIFEFSIKQLPDELSSIPIGIEKGITGFLFSTFYSTEYNYNVPFVPQGTGKKHIFLFNEETRASHYGIGTYIKNIIESLQDSDWEINVVHLKTPQMGDAFRIERTNVNNYFIANITQKPYASFLEKLSERYYQNALFLLSPYINKDNIVIFHLNYLHMIDLSKLLRNSYPSAFIIATVHYTNWSFYLLGDRTKLGRESSNKSVTESIEQERSFFKSCDHIIAIAKHSYDDLINLYQINEEKISLIPHGIKDLHIPMSGKERLLLKKKYGFSAKNKILIFAGRVDEVKGVYILLDAFISLAKEYPNLRLIIAGDGTLNTLLQRGNPFWSRIVFTGFLNKKSLYELYSIADIGVLPSLHEEFGYVALEMMMMNVPLIVNQTTGLSELITNKVNGATVNLDVKNPQAPANVRSLKESIIFMLKHNNYKRLWAKESRIIFEKKYSLNIFAKKMIEFYEKLILDK